MVSTLHRRNGLDGLGKVHIAWLVYGKLVVTMGAPRMNVANEFLIGTTCPTPVFVGSPPHAYFSIITVPHRRASAHCAEWTRVLRLK